MYINVNYPEVSWNGGHPKLDKFSIETHGFADSAFQEPPCKAILPRCLDIFLLGGKDVQFVYDMDEDALCVCVCMCVCVHVFACVSHLVCFVHCDIMSPLLVPTDIALSDPITYQPRQVLEPPWILTNILAKQFPLFVSLGSFLLHHIFNFIFLYIYTGI